jgi:hypothetical protein
MRRALQYLCPCALVAMVSCGTPNGGVRPDETSAEGHRREAERERAAAAEHAVLYDPGATRLDPAFADPSSTVPERAFRNPTEAHLLEADRHRAHARAHERAAQALERFEAAECKGVPPRERAACPLLGPVVAIRDLASGVRVELAPSVSVAAVVAEMRCHYAFARARGFSEEAAACPLYMRGIAIELSRDHRAVEITAATPDVARDIQQRVRIEAVHASRAPLP